ncbi:Rhodanese-related sulfurtransferase [Streptoalloteichus tenebrarius]|uniref:Rhodanese-related sulfurtransferase n=1 Tax=Streptoalloteichus tenebrarius (strain ATCC 17920 / DSM 40477 / JCM 4838 / CBS 697.72 / NBRC 16177 / NCIMB 11028 / NRRL B-12390 / A12253. 1 / ISP 5477) TaxID=1933 RepID=A0ABT1HWK9_STRSD|nr:rhodanese-like domain-containing protein [Streptoalloteichus tenebrarius]MCP2259894.1 Rhodanese-related sulfurtransferase [Streptoalloteichus tenebrarius]BFF03219.1 rhodanese-like domain-containing protein [Streptoalloteichus tenebrarius]
MTAEDLLREARADLDRLTPHQLAALRGRGSVLVVDIRPRDTRAAEGELPGAVPVERNVLEWRLDPTGEHRLPGVTADSRVVVLCDEGYASSLAARDLRRLGLPLATDLVGGFRAWKAAGLPVVPGGGPPVP